MRWLLALIMTISVVPAALAQTVLASRFVVGKWAWSCDQNAPPGGLIIDDAGKLIGLNGDWGCVVTKMAERRPHWIDKGPSWDFTARCDQPSEKVGGPGSFQGVITGTIELFFPSLDGKGRLSLRVFVNRPSQPGEKGLLALYPSEMYGPYARCE